jgi:hypothetical protein
MSIARVASALCLILLSACVQEAYDRVVVYDVDVSALKDVRDVGVRGDDAPLSWEQDRAMTMVVKDSLYRVTVRYRTGYLVTKAKFTVNGNFELQGKPNRRVQFAVGDTTFYKARFNQDDARTDITP